MKMIYYKEYIAIIEYDPEDSIYVGRLAGIDDIAVFHGSNFEELTKSFHELVDHYIEVSKITGYPAKKPATVELNIQIVPEIYSAITTAVKTSGKSLNQWACEAFSTAA